ncbi:MAG: alternate-type signal peptide domain-containing protein [Microbacteriaceae bacterium]
MHKLLKASIAGAAGIALLAGGAGTFAAWQDSAQISVSSIQSGKLDLASSAAGVWKNGSTEINPSSYLVVPGDVLTFTQNLTVEANGTNLAATLSQTGLTASGDLANDVTSVLDVTASGSIVSKNSDGTWKVTPGAGTSTLAVKVTVTFPKGTTGADNQAGQSEALNLSGLKFTLAQTIS